MMEATKEEKKFSCKVCEKSFPSYQAFGGHMRYHSGNERKTKSAYGNEEPEDLTLESKVKDVSGDLKLMKKSAYGSEELEDFALESKVKDVSGDLKPIKKSAYRNEEPEDLTSESKVKDVSGDLKRKTKSAYGNEEPEDLTPEVKVVAKLSIDLNKMPDSGEEELLENDIPESGAEESARKSLSLDEPEDLTLKSKVEDVALALIDLKKKSGHGKKELLEIDIPESGPEEAVKSLFLQMWPKDREKIQGTDPAPEEKQKIEQAAQPFDARFNLDGYNLKGDVGWTTRRRSGF